MLVEDKSIEQTKGGKEQDGQGELAATSRKCKAYLLNNWDAEITNVLIRHTSGVHKDELKVKSIARGAQSDQINITYETGIGADHDYWYVEFSVMGGHHSGSWACKNNFYCDMRSSDASTVVQMQLSAGDECLYVNESSGQCYVSLQRK